MMAMKVIKLAPVAVPVGLVGLVSLRIYAANQQQTGENQLLIPNQLSVYSAPLKHSKYIEEKPGTLQFALSSIRNTVHPYTAWCKSAYHSIENGIWTTVQFGKDSYVYLKNPPPEFLPKVGVITVSGLAGLFLARKGSRFKKIAYPVGLTGLGFSVCYPTPTVIFVKVAGKKVYCASHWSYEKIGSLWRWSTSRGDTTLKTIEEVKHLPESVVQKDQEESDMHSSVFENDVDVTVIEMDVLEESQVIADTSPSPTDISESESSPTLPPGEMKITKFTPDPKLADHGQSNPEDVDMYSTRS